MKRDFNLTIELVPSPCWYSNMRTNMPRSAWEKLREQVYAQYNQHCGICQISNIRMNCHEIWQYDDQSHIQRLEGFICLCDMCHHCKHMGLARILAHEGKLDFERVIEHFLQVNQCSREEYDEHSSQAWETWRARNAHEWTTEFGAYTQLVTPQKPEMYITKKDGLAYEP